MSRTWVASEAPRGTVRSSVLRGLLEPAPGIARKRVAMLYRPSDPASAARIVEADRRTAHFMAASASGLVHARAQSAVRAAEQAAAEEAAGAGLIEFGLVVTATVPTIGRPARRRRGNREPGGVGAAATAGRARAAGRGVQRRTAGRGAAVAAYLAAAPAGNRAVTGPVTGARMQAPAMWRGTTVQVCGLWPFAAGSGSPLVGAPLGQHLLTGVTVCGDPISWFQRAGLIANPSLFVLGRPGTGKSTLVQRMLFYMTATGVTPLVLGDLKPDYTDSVALSGRAGDPDRPRDRRNQRPRPGRDGRRRRADRRPGRRAAARRGARPGAGDDRRADHPGPRPAGR